jgi:hypothetical protein
VRRFCADLGLGLGEEHVGRQHVVHCL